MLMGTLKWAFYIPVWLIFTWSTPGYLWKRPYLSLLKWKFYFFTFSCSNPCLSGSWAVKISEGVNWHCLGLWRAGKSGVLQSMGSQRVGHDLATEQQQVWSPVSAPWAIASHKPAWLWSPRISAPLSCPLPRTQKELHTYFLDEWKTKQNKTGWMSNRHFIPIKSIHGEVGEGNGNPLQYSCLGNPMDRRAWRAAVHGVAKHQTWLNTCLNTKDWR